VPGCLAKSVPCMFPVMASRVCGWRTPSDDVAATQGLSMARMGTLGLG